MLIELDLPRAIYPDEYPGRLVLAVKTGGAKRYGIQAADPDEPPPRDIENLGQGVHAFELERYAPGLTLYYKATSWEHDVHFGEIPVVTLIQIRDLGDGKRALSFNTLSEPPTTVML